MVAYASACSLAGNTRFASLFVFVYWMSAFSVLSGKCAKRGVGEECVIWRI